MGDAQELEKQSFGCVCEGLFWHTGVEQLEGKQYDARGTFQQAAAWQKKSATERASSILPEQVTPSLSAWDSGGFRLLRGLHTSHSQEAVRPWASLWWDSHGFLWGF